MALHCFVICFHILLGWVEWRFGYYGWNTC
jgi:hypothetical protein